MNKNFLEAIEHILKIEGGYVDHPNDPGGATNFGISLRFYNAKIDDKATKLTIQALNKKEAVQIYYDHFWKGSKYESLSKNLASKMLDMAINMGHSQANKLLQRACRACGYKLVDDGIIGNQTIGKAKEATDMNEQALLAAVRASQAYYYRLLVAKNSKFKSFVNGWLRRANDEI